MSSSCSRAPAGIGKNAAPFQYPSVEGGIALAGPATPAEAAVMSEVANLTCAELQERLEAARREGQQEGETQARAAYQAELQSQAQMLSAALAGFAAERAAYFEKVEMEVVRLALAIAAKILHREAQLDPLLLAGVVRVALNTMDRASEISLCVPAAQGPAWRAWQERVAPDQKFQIVEDPQLGPGQCLLKTSLGSTELGAEAQLKEIEQGFFDLLAHRPGCTP
jgi:flagellar assembly protein FliH